MAQGNQSHYFATSVSQTPLLPQILYSGQIRCSPRHSGIIPLDLEIIPDMFLKYATFCYKRNVNLGAVVHVCNLSYLGEVGGL
jgi:hypothetical protein